MKFLAPWREAQGAVEKAEATPLQSAETNAAVLAMRHISPQEGAALLSKPKPMLSERQSKIVEFLKRTPDFATMRHLVLSFRSILCGGKVSSMKRWSVSSEGWRVQWEANPPGQKSEAP